MPDAYPLFVAGVMLLALTPGPNVALIVANSVAYGARYGLFTVAATAAALLVQLVLVGFGLSSALTSIGTALEWVRWIGAAYLILIGIQTWRTPAPGFSLEGERPSSLHAMLTRAAVVCLTNPKVLLFYGAFFPQFIAADRPIARQVWVMCVTLAVIAVSIDVMWALAASRARHMLRRHGRWRNRISGGLLTVAGFGLAFARPR